MKRGNSSSCVPGSPTVGVLLCLDDDSAFDSVGHCICSAIGNVSRRLARPPEDPSSRPRTPRRPRIRPMTLPTPAATRSASMGAVLATTALEGLLGRVLGNMQLLADRVLAQACKLLDILGKDAHLFAQVEIAMGRDRASGSQFGMTLTAGVRCAHGVRNWETVRCEPGSASLARLVEVSQQMMCRETPFGWTGSILSPFGVRPKPPRSAGRSPSPRARAHRKAAA